MYEGFKKSWIELFQFGTWIGAIIAGLIFKPDLNELSENWLPAFLQFICAVLAGLLFVLIKKFNTHKNTITWWIIAVTSFIITLLLAARYSYDTDRYTVSYANSKTVVGEKENLRPEAKTSLTYFEKTVYKRPLTIEEIVNKSAGSTETLWDGDFLRKRRFILLSEYSAFFFIITILIISLLQSIKLSSQTT